MNPSLWRQAQDVLASLLERPASERERALDHACGEDPDLRAEVRSLLTHAQALEAAQGRTRGAFLETPALGSGLAELSTRLKPGADAGARFELDTEDLSGSAAGPYRLERRLASGGMGTVYLASRADGQFEQMVAIKLIKRGMDSDEILRRFRLERQALAALEHPHIARLLDAGVTPAGRPYIAMELVDGLAIDEYADAHTLGVAERVRLFRAACEAVRFAHQRLIVHRDLKPRNILVTREGTPKLLDFGIAKMLGAEATEGATKGEERRLTPEYAAPEQLLGEQATTASDVYALGVILYELLCGRRPHAQSTNAGRTTATASTWTREALAPSAALARQDLSTAGIGPASAASIARTRGLTPNRLRRRLRGDLDTICLCAMHTDVARRYPSVEALAGDIDRFLAGLPITARKDSPWYRTAKLARRHWAPLAAAGLIAAVAAAGVAGIVRERNQAFIARDQAEAITDFLYRALSSGDTGKLSPSASIRDVLENARAEAQREFGTRPLILAAVLSALGRSHMGIGEYDKAEALMERGLEIRLGALGQGHHDVGESHHDLSELCFARNRLDEAEAHAREAIAVFEHARGGSERDMARALNNLGSILRRAGQLQEARAAHERALAIREDALGPEHPEVAESLNNLANVHRSAWARARAEGSQEGDPVAQSGALRSAIALVERSLEIREKSFPKLEREHPLILQSRVNLAMLCADAKDYERATALFARAIPAARESFGAKTPDFARLLRAQGQVLLDVGRPGEAAAALEEALAIQDAVSEPSDPLRLGTKLRLARCYRELGRPQDAASQVERIAEEADARFRGDGDWLATLEELEAAALWREDIDGAARWARERKETVEKRARASE